MGLLIVEYFGGYQVRFGAGIAEIENAAARKLVALAGEPGKVVMVQCSMPNFRPRRLTFCARVAHRRPIDRGRGRLSWRSGPFSRRLYARAPDR
jgi:hypothetical protein